MRKHEGKRPFGRPGHRWEDNIKMDLQKLDLGAWTGSSWFMDRWRTLVNEVMNLRVP